MDDEMADQGQQPTELQLALMDVEDAFLNLEFAIKLLSHCELGKLDPNDFDSDHLSQLKEGTVVFPKGNFSNFDGMLRAANIGVLIAFSASVFALDQAFQVAGIEPDLRNADDVVRLRTLIYMMRNAHAHGIAAPRWKISARYQGKLAVALGKGVIELDLAKLNGQECSVDQIGGYPAWYQLRARAKEILTGR